MRFVCVVCCVLCVVCCVLCVVCCVLCVVCCVLCVVRCACTIVPKISEEDVFTSFSSPHSQVRSFRHILVDYSSLPCKIETVLFMITKLTFRGKYRHEFKFKPNTGVSAPSDFHNLSQSSHFTVRSL